MRKRPNDVSSSTRIVNYNVRGRRGNIVQVGRQSAASTEWKGKRWEEMGRDGKGKWLGKQIGVEVIGIDWVLLFIKLSFKTS